MCMESKGVPPLPESVVLSAERPIKAENLWQGHLTTRAFLGRAVDHVVAVAKHEIRARCMPHISHPPGISVYLDMQPGKLALVPAG